MTTDFVVVGAGVIGCAVAVELARAGGRVTLIDRGSPGAAASGAAAGILGAGVESHAPGPMLDLLRWSRELYPAYVRELENATGITVGHRHTGVLEVALDDTERKTLEASVAWKERLGLRCRWLAPDAVAKLEPALGPTAGAVWHLDDQMIDPRRLVAALVRRAQLLGVVFVTGDASLRISDGQVDGVDVAGGMITGTVVVAGGSWSASLLGPDAVFPVRGQMLAFEAQPGITPDAKRPPLLGRAVFGDNGYLVPRGDLVLCGSTSENVGFDATVTDEGQALLEMRARRLCPALGAVVTRTSWAGLRPGTADGLPLIGFVRPGLWAAAGHFRNGVLLAPATAAMLGALIRRDVPAVDPSPFSPARLG